MRVYRWLGPVVLLISIGTFLDLGARLPDAAAAESLIALEVDQKPSDGRITLIVDGTAIDTGVGHVDDVQAFMFSDSKSKFATWKSGTTEFFAISDGDRGWTEARKLDTMIHLRWQEADPADRTWAPTKAAHKAPSGTRLHIVQLRTQSMEAYRGHLESKGAPISGFVPGSGYVTLLAGGASPAAIRALPYVRSLVPLPVAAKLHPSLVPVLDGAGLVDKLFDLVPSDRALKAGLREHVVAAGGVLISPPGKSPYFTATLDPSALLTLLQDDTLLWVSPTPEIGEDSDHVRVVLGVDQVERAAMVPDVDASGIRGHSHEIVFAHPDFSPAPQIYLGGGTVGTEPNLAHGTHSYGIVFGWGSVTFPARGFLPGGVGFYTPKSTSVDRYDLVEGLRDDEQVLFTTASWGSGHSTDYEVQSKTMDRIVHELDVPAIQSQGNQESQDSRPEAWGKNVISVGTINHKDNENPADDTSETDSSMGPAADGRIKPDLVAMGDAILTTTSVGGGDYEDATGTSAAAPQIAGLVGLVQALWTSGQLGNMTSGSTLFDRRAHTSTVKALLICSARQLPFEGTAPHSTNAPHRFARQKQGWGVPDLARLHANRHKLTVVNEDHVLLSTESKTYTFGVSDGQPILKVTLVYSDPEMTALTGTPHRINDLDLVVTDPDGNVYKGNYYLNRQVFSKRNGSKDSVNTVENVFIANPEAGTWTATVTAAELNADGHLETSATDADYALVILGRSPDPLPRRVYQGNRMAHALHGLHGVAAYNARRGPCAQELTYLRTSRHYWFFAERRSDGFVWAYSRRPDLGSDRYSVWRRLRSGGSWSRRGFLRKRPIQP